MELKLESFGQIISDDTLGEAIFNKIKSMLASGDKLTIDFTNIRSMATYNAKQIFGSLYNELGPANFFRRIVIKNASENILYIIRLGIQDSIQHTEVSPS